MIIFKSILMVILLVGAIIYFTNSAVALTAELKADAQAYFNPKLIIFSGACCIFVIMLFAAFMTQNIVNDSEVKSPSPKYELIHEPVYKKVN